MNSTSIDQYSVPSGSGLSSEAIIGIMGLVLAVFVPLVGFLLRQLLSKKLAKEPMQWNYAREPQLAELGLGFPESISGHHPRFATCLYYTFSTSAVFSDGLNRVNFWRNESMHLRAWRTERLDDSFNWSRI
ncbi:hypothetical protein HDK64DRAFT_296238 [Phyllosticta capitalensis]